VSFAEVNRRIEEMPMVFEDLRAKSDLAPLFGPGRFEFWSLGRNSLDRHARAPSRRITMTPRPSSFSRCSALCTGFGAAEHVTDDFGAVQPGQHVLAVADLAVTTAM
jgi:hypothetical protein